MTEKFKPKDRVKTLVQTTETTDSFVFFKKGEIGEVVRTRMFANKYLFYVVKFGFIERMFAEDQLELAEKVTYFK